MSERQIDVERVICRLSDIEDCGARGFAIGTGDWPLRGFVVRVRDEVRGYLNRCPHVGHPLNLRPHRFLTSDGAMVLCTSHGALFEKLTGYCVAGPCAGRSLQALPLVIESGFVLLADEFDPATLTDTVD
jgi:nitrite reductase/ring-hydroxylating ferredoxin subunit